MSLTTTLFIIMSMAYDPSERDYTVEYMVSTTADRFFIPVNSEDTMAKQLALCKKLVGKQKTDDTKEIGVEKVV